MTRAQTAQFRRHAGGEQPVFLQLGKVLRNEAIRFIHRRRARGKTRR